MDQRLHPRVNLPLLVELSHPTLGNKATTAKDLSDGGVFAYLSDHKLQVGAALKIKLHTSTMTATQTTPTVETRVVRIDTDGIALEFKNRTAQHLWSSVERLRQELQVGDDYFQVFQMVAVQHLERGILVVQQHGKWLLPGYYLHVKDNLQKTLVEFCADALGAQVIPSARPRAHTSIHNQLLPEASTYCVTVEATTTEHRIQLPANGAYRDWRWIAKPKDLADLTMAYDWIRNIVQDVLLERQQQR